MARGRKIKGSLSARDRKGATRRTLQRMDFIGSGTESNCESLFGGEGSTRGDGDGIIPNYMIEAYGGHRYQESQESQRETA